MRDGCVRVEMLMTDADVHKWTLTVRDSESLMPSDSMIFDGNFLLT